MAGGNKEYREWRKRVAYAKAGNREFDVNSVK